MLGFRPLGARPLGSAQITAASGPTAYTLTAAAGTYAQTGIDPSLRSARVLTALVGAYAQTGLDAGLTSARLMAAGQSSYTVTGVAANLNQALTFAAGAGNYALAGVDPTLSTTAAAAYTMAADAGACFVSGPAVQLVWSGEQVFDYIDSGSAKRRDQNRREFEERQDADKRALREIVERAFAEVFEEHVPASPPTAPVAPPRKDVVARAREEIDLAGMSATLRDVQTMVARYEREVMEAARQEEEDLISVLMVA